MNGFRRFGAGVCTVAVFVALAIWLAVLARTIGVPPVVDKSGKVTFDEFGNAKDILLAILPLATTSLGYWYGNQGSTQASDQAQKASTDASELRRQLSAVLDQADPGVLEKAKNVHPEVFAATE